jgi:MtaA/CmuA family methyltransferase
MTSRQRQHAFFGGEETDQPLNQPLLMVLAARMSGVSYKDYATDGRALASCQVRAAEEAHLDVISACSDPVREVHDLGGKVVWFEDEPPMPDRREPLLSDPALLARLKVPDPWDSPRMRDRLEGIKEMKRLAGATQPILGWVEGPISMGAGLREISVLMMDLIEDPDFVEDLSRFCTEVAIRFAQAQIEAGADMIGMGDAPASLIGPALYEEFVLPGEKDIISAIHREGALARLHICGKTQSLASLMGQSGADLVDFDSPLDFRRACDDCQGPTGILGNLDPVAEVRNGTPEGIIDSLRLCRDAANGRYVIGAGCEIPAGTPLPNLLAFHQFALNCQTTH